MRFEFATATRILFGPGTLEEVGPAARQMGKRALVVTGQSRDRAERLLTSLAAEQISHSVFAVAGEPTTETVAAGVGQARGERCDLVIGIGGGSAVDSGKAIAALLSNHGELLEYLEVIGKGKPLINPSA